ncbi:MAG: hypothetical protein IKX54_01780 [Lachnospiraceae bacterium]|nr:hypothetical protein [Lachnospiraceae bacterium]
MASSIMHVAISEGILREYPEIERNRFLLGSMFPDAAGPGNGHRKINVCEETKKTYDLPGFRAQFAEQLKTDPLYLGYYLHLVQDLVFRVFVYRIHHWDPRPEGNPGRLHNDYAITNSYIIGKYGLTPDLELPEGIENEALFADEDFDLAGFLQGYRSYFDKEVDGECFFFTREMADDCIAMCLSKCIEEVKAVRAGAGCIDEVEYAWNRHI